MQTYERRRGGFPGYDMKKRIFALMMALAVVFTGCDAISNGEVFTIEKDGNTWVIKGKEVEKLLQMTRFGTEEATVRFANKLRKMGIDQKLVEMGIEEGDHVRILDYEFEFR